MISTRDLTRMSDIDELRRLLQAMAMLDAILSPEWEYRYYSFNCRWSKGEQMGSMRDGQGDDLFALFNKAGCFLKGFAHESAMTPYRQTPPKVWSGVLTGVPDEFKACLKEPAFTIENTTFCIWRTYGESTWSHGDVKFPPESDPDGSAVLLAPLDGKPQSYRTWAIDYYEKPVKLADVRHIYAHRPLTKKLIASLNPELTLKGLAGDVAEIGYGKP